MDKERLSVALVQEPWIVRDRVCGLSSRVHLLVPHTVAFLKSCPISRTPKPNRSALWTPKLGQIRKEPRRLYNKAKERNCQGDWDAYHRGFKDFKKKCRRAERDSWAGFCEDN
ncbi:hypothetical protein ACLKA6_013505 [Drosophila palustris]